MAKFPLLGMLRFSILGIENGRIVNFWILKSGNVKISIVGMLRSKIIFFGNFEILIPEDLCLFVRTILRIYFDSIFRKARF
jgi:hypothetical protein